eukprot:7574-Pyramimonas_sp.AAC.1
MGTPGWGAPRFRFNLMVPPIMPGVSLPSLASCGIFWSSYHACNSDSMCFTRCAIALLRATFASITLQKITEPSLCATPRCTVCSTSRPNTENGVDRNMSENIGLR